MPSWFAAIQPHHDACTNHVCRPVANCPTGRRMDAADGLSVDMLPIKRKSSRDDTCTLHQLLEPSASPDPAGGRMCATQCNTPTSSSWRCCGSGASASASMGINTGTLEDGAAGSSPCCGHHKAAKTCGSGGAGCGDLLSSSGSATVGAPRRRCTTPATSASNRAGGRPSLPASAPLAELHACAANALACCLLEGQQGKEELFGELFGALDGAGASGSDASSDVEDRPESSVQQAQPQADARTMTGESESQQAQPKADARTTTDESESGASRPGWPARRRAPRPQLVARRRRRPTQLAVQGWHNQQDEEQQQQRALVPALAGELAASDADEAVGIVSQQQAVAPCWHDVPDDILARVLALLPPSQLRVLRLVCSGWERSVARSVHGLRPEALAGKRLAVRFPHLHALDLSHCELSVDLSPPSVLKLQSTLRDESLHELSLLTCLQHLSLRGCSSLDGSGLAYLPSLAPLTSLDLAGCTSLTDAGLRCLAASAPSLATLNLSRCNAVTAAGLWALLPLRWLSCLVLQGCFGDAGLQALAALPALQRVTLRRCPVITTSGVYYLLLAPALQRLVIAGCPQVEVHRLTGVGALQISSAARVYGPAASGAPAPAVLLPQLPLPQLPLPQLPLPLQQQQVQPNPPQPLLQLQLLQGQPQQAAVVPHGALLQPLHAHGLPAQADPLPLPPQPQLARSGVWVFAVEPAPLQ